MRTVAILAVLVLSALALALVQRGRGAATVRSGPASDAAMPAPAGTPALPTLLAGPALAVAWTAQAGARFEPCGCVAGMNGGLVRRASLLARVPRERRLAIEGGGWSGGAADHQLVRARRFLSGLAAAGEDAACLGRAEVALGRTRLASVLAAAPLPVLCANLPGGADLPLKRWLAVDRAGLGLALTAVAPPDAAGEGFSCGDPAEALLAVQAEAGTRKLVVLADLDERGLADLARAVPGVALVLGGAVGGPSPEPLAVGTARVAWVANEGKSLGWWAWGADACTFELIADAVPDYPPVRAVIRAYQDEIGGMGLEVDDRAGLASLGGGPAGASWAAPGTCTACHPAAVATHAASGHARAFAALQARGYDRDPDCLRCHVTGLGQPGGWQRRGGGDPAFAQVGCDACHGRGSLHAAERAAGRTGSGSLEPVTPATCMRCHDAENSPRFDYPTYWPRIVHDAR